MAEESVHPKKSLPYRVDPGEVVLGEKEFSQIEACASALDSVLRLTDEWDHNEKLDMLELVRIAFNRVLSQIEERLSDEMHGLPE
ncbi:MAG TPA: hypothetical protein VLV83_11320 [Acidobacteriota bacterium]|nr:hypothetical protein [Acidobacteriota bacterium]